MKPYRTYGKKGKKRLEKQQRAARFHQPPVARARFETEDFLPGGALIGLGEGIVVEWSEETLDFVFGGTSPGEMRGMKTFKQLQTLEDPALEAKKRQRQLRKKHGITLDDCLDEFESEEILSEQDTWYCPRCKEHRRASKKFDLWKTPDILVVHLKRFSSSGYRRDKIDILVDFPVEGLDLTKRVINKEDGKQEIFDLIAVDDHWGGLGGGHYTAFAKNFIDGEWYEYNGEFPNTPCMMFAPERIANSPIQMPRYRNRRTLRRWSRLLPTFCSTGVGQTAPWAVPSSKRSLTATTCLPQMKACRIRGKVGVSAQAPPIVDRRAL